MSFLVPIWLACGLVSVVEVYFRIGRPFRFGECLVYLLGGPFFWGCWAVMFVGGHLLLRRTGPVPVGASIEGSRSDKGGSGLSGMADSTGEKDSEPLAA